MDLFPRKHGIVVACDVKDLLVLEELVRATSDVDGIVGYKVGSILALRYGLSQVVEKISSQTDLPIIYDHQKLGSDIPEISGGEILEVLKEASIKGVIIFPEAGPETLRSAILGSENSKTKDVVKGCLRLGLVPMVGGEMTHKAYLVSDGGYISDDAPKRIYADAARFGVEYFIIPGTKIDRMRQYCQELEKTVRPQFLFPGIGKDYQGGDIRTAFEAVRPHNSYAIVGREIYMAKEVKSAARRLGEISLEETP
jgi:orotidine-5'-phosphate decarboxylase